MDDFNSSTSAPFVFAPSQAFSGNDGRWSSLILRIGTPEQNFAVLPSTTGHEIFVPLSEGCTADDPINCAELRGAYPFGGRIGAGLQVNASSTWKSIGLYTLDLGERLGLDGNGLYGLEKVGLQIQNSGGLSLEGQVVAGIATKNFYLGLFGLGPKPSNFTNYDYPIPSFMQTLKDKQTIPSVSYGYTAGAAYTIPQRYVSLTLGGYDASRFIDSGQTFPFNQDDSISLSLGVQRITAINTLLGSRSLLNTVVLSVIDSTTPYMWLPRESCDSFAEAFGLTFDNNTDLYVVNDTIREQLRSLKPSVTFSLGNDANPANLVSITLPYGAFDLQASHPIYAHATNYFPIRRAANDSQFTLGRSFLQEAYIIADYERSNFSVHQALLENPTAEQKIIAIASPSERNATDNVTQPDSSTGLGKPAVIGIAVGVAVLVLLLALLGMIWCRRHRRQSTNTADHTYSSIKSQLGPTPPEMPAEYKHEMYQAPSEAHGSMIRFELPAKGSRHLLSDDSTRVIGTPDGIHLTHELNQNELDPRPPKNTEVEAHEPSIIC